MFISFFKVNFNSFNFKPGICFMGHRQMANRIALDVTPKNGASHLGLLCLLQREFLSKN